MAQCVLRRMACLFTTMTIDFNPTVRAVQTVHSVVTRAGFEVGDVGLLILLQDLQERYMSTAIRRQVVQASRDPGICLDGASSMSVRFCRQAA